MEKLYKEVYSLDKECYSQGLNEYILMENAAKAIYEEIIKKDFKSICIIAGSGNNGADGIALARMLLNRVKVFLFLPMGVKSEMAKFQFNVYKNYGGEYSNTPKIEEYDCYVDAIFGSGLKRELTPLIKKIVKSLNKRNGYKIACDIPTGLGENGESFGEIFKADLTITMGAKKLALYSDLAKDYTGEVKVANLGVNFINYAKTKTNYYLLDKSDMNLPLRKNNNTHKGKFGHLGVVVGDKQGAGIIASLAALNFGAGLVSVVSQNQINLPYEIMYSDKIKNFNTIAFGMGLGDMYDNLLKDISKLNIKKVIDADMFYKTQILDFLDTNVILTPHPKEFVSLLEICGMGKFTINEIQNNRFEFALKFSKQYPNVVLILKGANSIIAYKNQLYINNLGTPALSKGGSGDVLTGMVASLLAQNYHPLKAAITGVIAHSLAGDIKPNYALTPIKLIQNLEKL